MAVKSFITFGLGWTGRSWP